VFVKTSKDPAVAVGHSVNPADWQITFDELMARIAGRFGRIEPRRTARAYLSALLSNCCAPPDGRPMRSVTTCAST
jgi:hypothetical protein